MPELPEVETVARGLAPLAERKRIEGVEIFDSKLDRKVLGAIVGKRILRVRRCGKQVVFDLVEGRRRRPGLHLVVHLRMTGRLLWRASLTPQTKHLRARLQLSNGWLDFVDPRRFGTMRCHLLPEEFAPMGVDPLSDELDVGLFHKLLGNGRQDLKAWLLRQDRLVGLGNIYASEILYAARLDPRRGVSSLSRNEVRRLHGATKRILDRAIERCGTTFSDFQDARGQSGGFARFLKVYRREGAPCRRCKKQISRIVQHGRSTFFCDSCQR